MVRADELLPHGVRHMANVIWELPVLCPYGNVFSEISYLAPRNEFQNELEPTALGKWECRPRDQSLSVPFKWWISMEDRNRGNIEVVVCIQINTTSPNSIHIDTVTPQQVKEIMEAVWRWANDHGFQIFGVTIISGREIYIRGQHLDPCRDAGTPQRRVTFMAGAPYTQPQRQDIMFYRARVPGDSQGNVTAAVCDNPETRFATIYRRSYDAFDVFFDAFFHDDLDDLNDLNDLNATEFIGNTTFSCDFTLCGQRKRKPNSCY